MPTGFDTNLIVALDALLAERSVTRAARRLGVGQPAMSHSLARLRVHFKDPLLLLRGREMVLSEKASRLVERVARAVAALDGVIEGGDFFDGQAPRTFVLATTDLSALRFVPQVLRTMKEEAQAIDLNVRRVVSRSTEDILADGVDLAIGAFDEVPAPLKQQYLSSDPFVCLVRDHHPVVGQDLTLETYLNLSHLEVLQAPHGGPGEWIDRSLAAAGERRRVSLRLPCYSLAASILRQSDHVLTTTEGTAQALLEAAPLRIMKPPIDIPPLAFWQVWHRRYDHDEAHRWLREIVVRICGTA